MTSIGNNGHGPYDSRKRRFVGVLVHLLHVVCCQEISETHPTTLPIWPWPAPLENPVMPYPSPCLTVGDWSGEHDTLGYFSLVSVWLYVLSNLIVALAVVIECKSDRSILHRQAELQNTDKLVVIMEGVVLWKDNGDWYWRLDGCYGTSEGVVCLPCRSNAQISQRTSMGETKMRRW